MEVIMNSKELLYVASTLEAEAFYGIKDGFYGMNPEEIAREIIDVKRGLYDKGFATMDFNGEYELDERITNLVNICCKCKKFISLEKTIENGSSSVCLYAAENGVVAIFDVGTEYRLTDISLHDIKNTISDFIKPGNIHENEIRNNFFIDNGLLFELKTVKEIDFSADKLCARGCDEEIAKIIYGALKGYEEFCAILFMDFAETREAKSIMFIKTDASILSLRYMVRDDDEGIEITPQGREWIDKNLEYLYNLFIPCLTEDFT